MRPNPSLTTFCIIKAQAEHTGDQPCGTDDAGKHGDGGAKTQKLGRNLLLKWFGSLLLEYILKGIGGSLRGCSIGGVLCACFTKLHESRWRRMPVMEQIGATPKQEAEDTE